MTMVKVKNRNLILAIVLCVLSFLTGIFFLIHPSKTTKIEASADASSTSEMLYWEAGAAADVNAVSAYKIRFTLHIDIDTFNASGNNLLITFGGANPSSNADSQVLAATLYQGGAKLIRGGVLYNDVDENGEVLDTVWEKSVDGYSITSGKYKERYYLATCSKLFDLESTEKFLSFYIVVEVGDIHQDITVNAGIYNSEKKLIQSAISDTRNLYYIWEKAVEYEDAAVLKNPYVSEYVSFAQNVETADFEISPAVQLSDSFGMTLQVNIPAQWKSLLYNPTQEDVEVPYSDIFGAGTTMATKYTNYYLAIVAANSNAEFAKSDLGSSNIKFTLYKGATLGDYVISAVETLPKSFKDNTCGSISERVPLYDGYSYYYAYIVKAVSMPGYSWDGIGSTWWHSGIKYELSQEVVAQSENQQYFSTKEIAKDMLERNLTLLPEQQKWLLTTAGVEGYGGYVDVKVIYKQMQENAQNYGQIATITETKQVPLELAFSQVLVESYLSEHYKIRHPAMYNIVFSGAYIENGYRYDTDARIAQQASAFEYAFHAGTSNTDSYGTLEVVYNDFQYKDLNIRITNNDWNNHLTMNWYTTLVEVDETADTTTLTYTYDEIEKQLYNSCMWLFDIKASNIAYNNVDGVTVTTTDEAVQVTYENAKVNNLLSLSLTAVAEIFEDYDVNVTYKYAQYKYENGRLHVGTVKSEPFVMRFSQWQGWLNFENFMTKYGDVINGALDLERLEGDYYIPYNIQKNTISGSETPTAEIVVQYKYNPIFMITDNISNYARYKSTSLQTANDYSGEFFVADGDIPDTYRVASITSASSRVQVTSEEDYKKLVVTYKGSRTENLIIPITVSYSNLWKLNINYMQQIAGTPFAKLSTVSTTVKVSDYKDIYALTKEDVLALLPISTYEITGSVTVEKVNVTFDDVSTYTVDLDYSHASLKQINYEGEMKELKVPLTSYADWCDSFGKDWSILMLNTEKKKYFKYSSDVERDKLYGLFTVAIYDEQVSDLNSYFKNATGDGTLTVFTENQVKGSTAYKFFNNMRTKGIVTSLLGHVGMSFCEIVNDDNVMQYMHYFYLDGTNPGGAFDSNGGADNAYDTDDSLTNKGEDIVDDIKDAINQVADAGKNSPWIIVLNIMLGIIAGTALVGVVYWILKKSGVIRRRRKSKVQKQPKAKKKKMAKQHKGRRKSNHGK